VSWLEKLHISHKQMAIGLTVLCLLPIVLTLINVPLVLPLTIGQITKDFYNEIQKLPEGSIIAWCNAQQYRGYVGARDMYKALFYHIFDRKLKLIGCSFAPDTPQLWADAISYSGIVKKYSLIEGRDFVFFPFLAGEESAFAAAAADFYSAYSTDIRGITVRDLPLMQQVRSLRDVQLVIHDGSSFTQVDMFVRQWPAAYDVRAINLQVYATSAPYYGRFVFGDLDGTRGAAEYEALTGYVGEELVKMNARNLQGLFVLVFVAIANVTYFALRTKKIKVETKEGR
jgi:hypothetical protein